jgi:thiamine biosynthesis lipoprotein
LNPVPPESTAASRDEGGTPFVERVDDHYAGRFTAMASPCDVLVDTDDREEASTALRLACTEARRIEAKFSRYREDSVVGAIHRTSGQPVAVDEETARLLDYADTCWRMSDGLFDITSGVLRRVWKFDGGEQVPSAAAIHALLGSIGWQQVEWHDRRLTLPAGMEIDLGGIGKEYAVDRSAACVREVVRAPFLLNFGGDLFAEAPRRGGKPWGVGVDDPERTGEAALYRIDLSHGGLATSGDARRYVRWRGKRLGHILNPKTGWPVEDAPRSISVLAPTCLEAGTLATLAYLQGPRARAFLEDLGVPFRLA